MALASHESQVNCAVWPDKLPAWSLVIQGNYAGHIGRLELISLTLRACMGQTAFFRDKRLAVG